MKNKFNFDKFVKDIVKRNENHLKKEDERIKSDETLPQRRFNKLYREHWQNSTRFYRKKK